MVKAQMNQKNKNQKAFSLIEVMLAMFLVTIGMLAVSSLISKGLIVSIDARNQLIAGELAQEGIELVRNIRDNNWQSTSPTATSFDSIVLTGCTIDKGYSVGNIGCLASKKLYIDATGFYVHNAVGTSPTKFSRIITIAMSGAFGRTVTSYVSWNNADPNTANCTLINKCVSAQTTLTTMGRSQ